MLKIDKAGTSNIDQSSTVVHSKRRYMENRKTTKTERPDVTFQQHTKNPKELRNRNDRTKASLHQIDGKSKVWRKNKNSYSSVMTLEGKARIRN